MTAVIRAVTVHQAHTNPNREITAGPDGPPLRHAAAGASPLVQSAVSTRMTVSRCTIVARRCTGAGSGRQERFTTSLTI
jgi:hypothetical protein